jgi:site-specific DNA-methyltransferase (adenine-specific)
MENMINKITNADCFEVLKQIPDKTIDLIIADPPYGTTGIHWDRFIDFKLLWSEYNRVAKDSGIVIFFGSQPFSSKILMLNEKNFRYEVVWDKTRGTNFIHCRSQILKAHENIFVFYKKKGTYNPQMSYGAKPYKTKDGIRASKSNFLRDLSCGEKKDDDLKNAAFKRLGADNDGSRYPTSIQTFKKDNVKSAGNPTAKPILLIEWLIKTYSNTGDTILDSFSGSFTTAVACNNLNRNWICIELDKEQCEFGKKRILDNKKI